MSQSTRTIGRYDVLEVIGRGGAATVYLARQRDLDRRVALKELSPHLVGDPQFALRFVGEARLAASLSHPSIVTVHEYFVDGELPYIAMEHVARGSLRRYIGTLSLPQVAGVLESVLGGLAHAASEGIVHRDLKPENLLVALDGRVKIADFGVARALARTQSVVTATGSTIGTPAYMAPEQALDHPPTAATDLYSLGIVAWEMLAGHTPFSGRDTPVAVLYRQVHEAVPLVSTVVPSVEPALAGWVAQLLAKEPQDRFGGSPQRAWEELEDILIETVGPRWRREARLGEAPPERPSAAAREIDLSQTPQTVVEEPVSADTVLRSARRHRAAEAPVAAPPRRRSKRRAWLQGAGLAAACAAAIAGGVLLGSGGGSARAPRPRTVTQAAAPSTAQLAEVAALTTFLADDQRRSAALRAARGEAGQARAAGALAGLMRSGAADPRLQGRPPVTGAMRALAADYSALAAAARRGDASGYRVATGRIGQDAARLRAALSAG